MELANDYGLTPDQAAKELIRRRQCRESIIGFAQNIRIPKVPENPDEDEDKLLTLPPGAYMSALHILMCNKLQQCMTTDYGRLIITCPPGAAKALALDTPIPTPSGWSTMGDLQVGDEVFDDQGKPCRVTWKSPIFHGSPCYRVITDCGDEIVADQEHEWLVRLCGKPRRPLKNNGKGGPSRPDRDDPMSQFRIAETWELAKRRAKKPMIKRADSLKLPDIDLPIDPYLLGVWLGDGNSAGIRITSSVEDQVFIRSEIERLGYQTTDQSVSTNFGVLGVRGLFVKFGLLNDPAHNTFGKKAIPEIYLRSSYQQRLSLLQGLIDTDGTVCRRKGSSTFCNINKELALQVRELIRSLGVKAGWSISRAVCNGKDCGEVYRVSFYLKDSARLPRKRKLTRNQHRTPNTYVRAIAMTKRQDTVCIEVDSESHLYLAGQSMTPTHNSTYGTVVAPTWYMGTHPGSEIILASHGLGLAKMHGGRGRNIVQQEIYQSAFGTTISKDSTAKESWALTNGSEYKSFGIISGIAGHRAAGLVADDPLAGRESAESPTMRQKVWEAFSDDLMTRLKPRAWAVLILTRWHCEDPAGMLLPDGWDGESGVFECRDGMQWEVLNIVAKVETEKQAMYDPLGRQIGQYIWPEWFDAMHWLKHEPRKNDPYGPSERSWASLFQGKPVPDSGGEWQREWAHRYPLGEHPEYLMVFTASDFALTDPKSKGADRDPDWTEHGVAGLDESGNLWFLDWWYGRGSTDLTIAELLKLAKRWNCRRGFSETGIIRRAIEPQIRYWQRQIGWRHSMTWLHHISDKRAKFQSFRSLGSAGKVFIPECPWGDRLVDELCNFLQRGHDDVGDVCGMFGQGLEDMPWSRQRVKPQKQEGVKFGSWEWLTMDSENEPEYGLDRFV